MRVRPQLHVECLGERAHGVLGSGVDSVLERRDERLEGAHQNDGAESVGAGLDVPAETEWGAEFWGW